MFKVVCLPEVVEGRYGKPDTVIQHRFYTESGLSEVSGLPWNVVYQWLMQHSETRSVPRFTHDFGWLFPVSVIDHLKGVGAFTLKKTESRTPAEK